MQISENSWHYKLYIWSYWKMHTFYGWNRWDEPMTDKVNICPYMRHLLIWFPLTILLHVAFVAWVFWGMGFGQITSYGWEFFSGTMGGIFKLIFSIAVIFGLFFLIYLVFQAGRFGAEKIWKMFESKKTMKEEKEERSSFAMMIAAWYKANKERFCPTIEVKKDNES